MSDDTRIGLHYATDQQRNVLANQVVDAAWARVREPMVQIVIVFFEAKLGSVSLMQLET